MSIHLKRKKKKKLFDVPPAGTSPGQLYIDENALKPVITIHSFNAEEYKVEQVGDFLGLNAKLSDSHFTYWIDVKGYKSDALFGILNEDFNIHKLVIEDITRTYQRPIFEEYDDYVFSISRMLYLDEENCLGNEQIAFILKDNFLFTFQEHYVEWQTPIINRLKAGKGNIRISGNSYIMYALMDVIIDQYFLLLSNWGEELDKIEDRLMATANRDTMFDIQAIKRNLINIRRVAWPERDKLNDILRSDSPLITDHTKVFVKDAYDHCIQAIDIVESLKEIVASDMDMYLSIISNRMNEIMKVLTVISSIFIPLTFIAGIYGMNFAKQDPVTGKLMPHNMPELYADNGYIYTMIFMAIIALAQLIYFWLKGWFK
jgi:magnesium transporter